MKELWNYFEKSILDMVIASVKRLEVWSVLILRPSQGPVHS